MIKPTVFCDVCGKPKQAVNHWLMVNELSNDFQLMRWDDDDAKKPKMAHLCGAECVVKKVNEFLGSK